MDTQDLPVERGEDKNRDHDTVQNAMFRAAKRPAKENAVAKKASFKGIFNGSGTPIILALMGGVTLVSAAMIGFPKPLQFIITGIGAITFLAGLLRSNQIARSEKDRLFSRNEKLANRLEDLEDKSWEIRESEEIHRTLAESFGDVVLHRNSDGQISFTNRIYDQYFDQDHPVPNFDPESALLKSEPVELETKQGKCWFSWTQMAVRDSQTGLTGWQAVGRDVTANRLSELERETALEMAQSASEARSRFLATMSHEIRTPLNGILGMNRLLQGTALDATQQSYSNAIGTSGEILLGLVEDVLDTALVDAGKLTLDLKSHALRPLLEDLCELVATHHSAKRFDDSSTAKPPVPINLFIAQSCPTSIHVDAKRLRQVLLNLLGNGMKFTEKGGVGLFVETTDEGLLKFSVHDSGPGLSEADQKLIFEEFQQADTSATRRHGGAGLGLSIAKQLVSLMGGRLAVNSKLGDGSIFHFTCPFETVEAEQEKDQAEQAVETVVALIMPRSPARDALARSITQEGADCHCFDNDALYLAAREAQICAADVVILSQNKSTDPMDTDAIGEAHQGLHNAGDITLFSLAAADFNEKSPKQQMLEQRHSKDAPSFDGWLTWPVRGRSIKRLLNGGMKPEKAERQTVVAPPLTTAVASNSKSDNLKPSVLLAEDNAINALLAQSLLKKLDYDVTTVSDGKAAVESVALHTYDIILMDLHMPVMDGLEAIRGLRKLEQEQGRVPSPVIVLSADNQPAAQQQARTAGANDFLLKPLDFDSVQNCLAHHLSLHQAAEQRTIINKDLSA